ncbi:MAG: 6-O-methylguanine methyltransferase [Proteobacteria bacterium]|nr:6-O-methylguanine methyltransferase [Pseudomonadota bacterium]
MRPDNPEQARQYVLVARAISFIQDNAKQQPSLEQVAVATHVSPFHLQRLFAEWAGISPKRFLQYLTKEYAKQKLMSSHDVLTVTEGAGLSSTSRLHDLMVTCEAMTPGEIKAGYAGMEIIYGFAFSPFGEAIVAWTKRGICHFAFSMANHEAMLAELVSYWPNARFSQDDSQAQHRLQDIFPTTPSRGRVHLVLRGTNFQIKVWEALVHTDFGRVTSYQQLAERAGCPRAQRAVGTALAANHIGYLIPCHRVIRESGDAGSYRWGAERKLAMLAWEAARANQ